MKQKKGITLLALVITIIILLILAGITLNLTLGQNGIITRAKEAGKNYMDAAEREQYDLAKFLNETENMINQTGGNENSNENTGTDDLKQQITEQQETIKDLQDQIASLNEILSQTNAKANHILAGYKAYSEGNLLTGTMENRGELNWKPTTGTTYIIPEGYYSGGVIDSRDAYNAGKNSATYRNFTIIQKTYAFSYTVPYNGRMYIAWSFTRKG